MLNIGCHLSNAGGFTKMAQTAQEIGANTFQYFTRNPRGGKAKEIDKNDVQNFLNISSIGNFAPIVAHAPYTLNLCSHTKHIREFSKDTLTDDLFRTQYIPNSFYNLHPGSHTGQGTKIGIDQIASALNYAIKPNQSTVVLLETMAGKGSEIGGNFEELKSIIDKIELQDKIGVCFDTCHVFDAGYDLVNNLENVLNEFEQIIGLERIKVIHLNDSKNKCASKKDRHELIGKGHIGLQAITAIINHPRFSNLPFILETPQENISGYAEEIKLLKSLKNKDTH